MDAVRGALEKAGGPCCEAEVTFVPQSTVRVEGKEAPRGVAPDRGAGGARRRPERLRQLRHSRTRSSRPSRLPDALRVPRRSMPRCSASTPARRHWLRRPRRAGRGSRVVATGVIATAADLSLEARVHLHLRRRRLGSWRPTRPTCSCSRTCTPSTRFPRTALLMAHARGVICLAARQRDVDRAWPWRPPRSSARSRPRRRLQGADPARGAAPPRARRGRRAPSHVADALALALTGLSRRAGGWRDRHPRRAPAPASSRTGRPRVRRGRLRGVPAAHRAAPARGRAEAGRRGQRARSWSSTTTPPAISRARSSSASPPTSTRSSSRSSSR